MTKHKKPNEVPNTSPQQMIITIKGAGDTLELSTHYTFNKLNAIEVLAIVGQLEREKSRLIRMLDVVQGESLTPVQPNAVQGESLTPVQANA